MGNFNACIREKANPLQISECRKRVAANEESFTLLSGILALAGNEARLKIIYLLDQEKELCPCDLSDILGMSIPAVSQHLRKMKDGNIVVSRKERQTIFYSLKAEHLNLLHPILKIVNRENLKPERI